LRDNITHTLNPNTYIDMKNCKLLLSFCLFIIVSSCGPTIYKASNFENSKNTVKTLAILPFNISIDSKRLPKGTTIETLKESEEKTGYDIQSNAYTWLLQRQKNYSTTFQDIDKTNALIKKANITYDNIALQDKGELCKMLGVDGIISGKATMSKPMSEGAAVAVGLLVGAWGATNKTTTSLTIHDTKGSLLWKYDYEASGSVGSSAESLAKALMKNASKKFPYKN
jgi:hypothetical protein